MKFPDNSRDDLERIKRVCGGLGHDLNNYMCAIQGYAELLGMELPPDPETSSYLTGILEGCQRVSRRTDLLENFAQNQPLSGGPCDLNSILSELRKEFHQLAQVTLETDPGKTYVMGEPTIIAKIIREIINNAIESYRETTPLPAIRISIAKLEEVVRVSVEDHGCGMTSQVMDHVYDPYFSTRGRGRGFGLTWVHGWASRMGASLDMESSPGQGSRVSVGFLRPTEDERGS